eukprot:2221840-Prymnesium_polylepis.1
MEAERLEAERKAADEAEEAARRRTEAAARRDAEAAAAAAAEAEAAAAARRAESERARRAREQPMGMEGHVLQGIGVGGGNGGRARESSSSSSRSSSSNAASQSPHGGRTGGLVAAELDGRGTRRASAPIQRLQGALRRDERLSSAAWAGAPVHVAKPVHAAIGAPTPSGLCSQPGSCTELSSLHEGLDSLQHAMLQRRSSATTVARDMASGAAQLRKVGRAASLQWAGTKSYADQR